MTIRLPRLLDAELQERARLEPVRLTLDLQLTPLSTAEMTLPSGEPPIAVRDLIELYDETGSVGVFRVSAIDEQPGGLRTLYLEHGLATLADNMVPSLAFTGSGQEAVATLLSKQADVVWTLGDADLPEDLTVLFACGFTNLLTALMQLMELLPEELQLVCDQSALPWTLHLRSMSADDACEGRLSRNLSDVRVNTDAADLCTRVYPYGAGQGTDRISLVPLTGSDHLDSPAMARWGCISRTISANTIYDVPTLKAVAERYLDRHSEPTISITASAVDLSAATGEDADSFRLGRMCRLALPDHDLTLRGRVIALHKPDLIRSPCRMTVTLSNRQQDTSDEIASMLREVTANRFLGGRVIDVASNNRASGASTSPIVHYFNILDWAAVLSCIVVIDPDAGVKINQLKVDGTTVDPALYATNNTFDALPYLRRNDLGVIDPGRHLLAIHPDSGMVSSSVTLKVIEKVS